MKQLLLSLALGLTMSIANAAPVKVLMETTEGNITLELDSAKAPKSVANFVQYAKDGHYDGLVFHRVIKGFMIQGGGYVENAAKNGLKNDRGTIAMARTSVPHSASSQFFINHGDNDFLNYPGQDGWGYAVFGKVTEGMDVVDKIAETRTGNLPPFGRDVPVTPIVIRKVTVIEAK